MIDLSNLARRHGLALGGRSVSVGTGRIVPWGESELAYTCECDDDSAVKPIENRVGLVITFRGDGMTMTFPPAKLAAVAKIAREVGSLAI